jgi:uncharacterized membrane protein
MTKPFYAEPLKVNSITGFALVIVGLLVMFYEIPSFQVVGIAMAWAGVVVLLVTAIMAALGLVLGGHKGGPENRREDRPVN